MKVLFFSTMLLASAQPALAADWNAPQEPFAVYGNTYYVGTRGLSSVLLTSSAGHILFDGGSPESAAHIARHIRQLGFRIEDIKYILNTHEHVDHAGGIAELQRMSGAIVLASAPAAAVLRTGLANKADPQYGDDVSGIAPVARLAVQEDGAVVSLGPLRVTARYTPGHTPGGVSWTWQSQEGGKTANLVYADSLNAITLEPFRYSAHPQARADMARSIALVAALPCDILVSAHPEQSDLWQRLEQSATQGHAAFIDRSACRTYAANASARLAKTLAQEAAQVR